MTDFRNVKLRVLSREHSAAFQEAAFEAGVSWRCKNEVKNTGAKYLFISDDPAPKLSWDNNRTAFDSGNEREITFTTPAYLKTKIQIRDKEHFDFVLEKLKQNGVQGTKLMKELAVRDGDYIVVTHDGLCGAVAREMISNLSRYKEIFIEKDDTEPDDTATQDISTYFFGVETGITTRFIDTETSDGSTDGYEKLTDVLQAAHNQAAHGKGKDRHANGQPFHEQRMQAISKLIKSPKGMEFQAIKKLTEGMQFDDHDRREAELLGAINYIAGIVIYFRENKDENQ